MRDIKFRAWHKEKRIMAAVSELVWDGKVHVSYKSGPEREGFFFGGNWVGDDWKKGEHELMQYTGLKDMDNKEIYEGDIVEVNMGTTSPGYNSIGIYEEGHDIRYLREVAWVGTGLDWKGNKSGSTLCEGNCKYFKVIGNIHQNPELL